MTNITAVAISDLHCGHKHTPTSHLAKGVSAWLVEHRKTIISSDIFIISGDIWDRLTSMLDSDIRITLCIMNDIMRLCNDHGIVLRVLEGTRLHEWGQSNIFQALGEAYPTLDYAYIAHLQVERHKALGVDILYVPDDLTKNRKDIEPKVKAILSESGISKVDISILHTQFPHQLPKNLGIDFSDPQFFIDLTRLWIVSGHIHPQTTFDKIITPGSFDVLEHGPNIAKGGVHITMEDDKPVFTMMANKNKCMYRRIKVPKEDAETVLSNTLNKLLTGYTGPVNIQFTGGADHTVAGLLATFKARFKGVNFSRHILARKRNTDIISVKQSVRDVKKLQVNVLPALLEDHLIDRNLPKDDITLVLKLLGNIELKYKSI